MTCSIPHDDCPLFEEAEDHLACFDFLCRWTYENPRRNAMTDDVVIGELVRTLEIRAIDSDGKTILDGRGRPICGVAVVTRTDQPGEYGLTINRPNYDLRHDIEECILIDPAEKRAHGPVRE
jgi:hypothetical protein